VLNRASFIEPGAGPHSAAKDVAARVAVVGCGAIAECYHVPAVAQSAELREGAILIDSDLSRARELAARFGIRRVASDIRNVMDDVDCAILAVPHHLHHSLGMMLLDRGVHVLCEKPLAACGRQARQMVARAREHNVILCVNQTRRLFPAYREIRRLVSSGALGELHKIEYLDGKRFHWPTASGFYFQQRGGRGVLLDKGIHGLDAICWWLGGKPDVVVSGNDSFGGPESAARLRLQYGPCDIDVRLSWLVQLENTYKIVGSLGTVTGNIEQWDSFAIDWSNGKRERKSLASGVETYNDFGKVLIDDFVQASAGGARPRIPAEETIDAIELIDDCYEAATRFDMPWCDTWSDENGR